MKKQKPINRNLAEGLRPLRQVQDDTTLPYVFDLQWDAKVGRDLDQLRGGPKQELVMRLLAEAGYDAKEWADRYQRPQPRASQYAAGHTPFLPDDPHIRTLCHKCGKVNVPARLGVFEPLCDECAEPTAKAGRELAEKFKR